METYLVVHSNGFHPVKASGLFSALILLHLSLIQQIHSASIWLSTYEVPGAVLHARDTPLNRPQRGKAPALRRYILGGRQTLTYINKHKPKVCGGDE